VSTLGQSADGGLPAAVADERRAWRLLLATDSALTLVSVVLSLAISLRYIIWRGLETLNLGHGFLNGCVSLLLYGAEIYTVFVLIGGYFQTTIFLDRRAIPLPADPDKLPSVDIFIPTYNESVEIVRRTAVAAMAIDYPKKKVYILDDGRRAYMKALADEVGRAYSREVPERLLDLLRPGLAAQRQRGGVLPTDEELLGRIRWTQNALRKKLFIIKLNGQNQTQETREKMLGIVKNCFLSKA
jgi:hypothetical protein